MRTTLTIEEDVAVQIERLRRSRGSSLKEIVNQLLRRGLESLNSPPRPPSVQPTRSVDLGRCLIGNVDDVSDALAVGEGERFQ